MIPLLTPTTSGADLAANRTLYHYILFTFVVIPQVTQCLFKALCDNELKEE